MDDSKQKIDDKDLSILREKNKRQAEVAVDVEKRKAVEQTVDNLHDWVDEFHVKLLNAKASAKRSEKKT